jgi:hypothetical protein
MCMWKSVAVVFLSFAACAAYAGSDLVWSHTSLTGQTAKEQFLADSSDCVGYATGSIPMPQDPRLGAVSSASDVQGYQEASDTCKKQRLHIAASCMTMRGWSSKISRSN